MLFRSVILKEPIFSTHGGLYNSSISLQLLLPENAPESAEIRFTTDGSEPKYTSQLYVSPISINKTTCVKAKLFAPNSISIKSTAHSYIFHGREATLPIISINMDKSYLYDNKFGIDVDGTYSQYLKNYQHNWRRPANIEYFPLGRDDAEINQLAELRIGGGASRDFPLKTFMIYSNKRFGTKHFSAKLWNDKPDIKIKSFMLRNAGNDFYYTYFRDAAIQIMFARNADIDWQAYQPAIVYINGEYRGIQNIRGAATLNHSFWCYMFSCLCSHALPYLWFVVWHDRENHPSPYTHYVGIWSTDKI